MGNTYKNKIMQPAPAVHFGVRGKCDFVKHLDVPLSDPFCLPIHISLLSVEILQVSAHKTRWSLPQVRRWQTLGDGQKHAVPGWEPG